MAAIRGVDITPTDAIAQKLHHSHHTLAEGAPGCVSAALAHRSTKGTPRGKTKVTPSWDRNKKLQQAREVGQLFGERDGIPR